DRDAVLEARAETRGRLRVAAQDFERAYEAVRRAEDAADNSRALHRRVQSFHVFGAQAPRFLKAAVVLHRLRRRERVKLRLVRSDEQIAALTESRINSRLVAEGEQLLAREQREADVDRRRELRAEAARGAPRAPLARSRAALQNDHSTTATRREVVSHARADDSAPDDDYIGRFHPCC